MRNGIHTNPAGARDAVLVPHTLSTDDPQQSPRHKEIVQSSEVGTFIDRRVVAQKYYNCFNFSLLARNRNSLKYTVGVTSPNSGEGKTFVACNLAASLALGSGMKTVLVDLNTRKPRVHEIFGTAPQPGLLEALGNGTIHVSATQIEGLSVLPAGNQKAARLGLGDLMPFQRVLSSLEQEYQFVIIDMPSITSAAFPLSMASLLNGLLLVVDTRKTRRRDVDRVFRQMADEQILGLVFNRFNENTV